MNRLLNIKRTGGYPVDAEVIELLYNQRLYIEALFGALELPAGSVVFLEANSDFSMSGYRLAGSYVYVVPHQTTNITVSTSGNIRGKLYYLKGDSSVSIFDLLNDTAAKRGLKINEYTYSTTDEHNVVYADYMSVVEAELIADANYPYTFYKLSDVIEMGKWTYLDINSDVSLNNLPDMEFHNLHRSFIKMNGERVEIQLGVKYTGLNGVAYTGDGENITLTPGKVAGMGLAVGECYPLQCVVVKPTGEITNVACALIRKSVSEVVIRLKLGQVGGLIETGTYIEVRGGFYV